MIPAAMVMATVADRIRDAHDWLKDHDVNCTLEWNPGNHFRDPDIRTAKAFVWVSDPLAIRRSII